MRLVLLNNLNTLIFEGVTNPIELRGLEAGKLGCDNGRKTLAT